MNIKQIITIELDIAKDIKYRNPLILSSYVREEVEKSKEEHYLFVDEIQMSDEVANPYNPDGKKITFSEVYIKDIVERKRIERQDVLEQILDLLCSSVDSLTNPTQIANTLKSKQGGGLPIISTSTPGFCFDTKSIELFHSAKI